MTPIHIEGQTTGSLAPPDNWNAEAHGPCATLSFQPVQNNGIPGFASFWQLSGEELAEVNDGGIVQLTIHGATHPVVSLATVGFLSAEHDLRPPPTGEGPEQLRAQRDVLLECISTFLDALDTPGSQPDLSMLKQMRHVRSVCRQGGLSVDDTDLAITKYLRENGIGSLSALKEILNDTRG